jgi:dipeptidyl aminopeptidase/acylaminoacyl peptidase
MRIPLCLFVALIVGIPRLAAAEPVWTLDDTINTESIRDVQVSPDGRWAVWVHVAPNKQRGETVGNLVRLELSTGRETVLTRGNDNCTSPRWSPDSQRLAFLRAGDDGKNQLWLLDPSGGEPWPITEWRPGIAHFDWAGAKTLVFAAPVRKEESQDKDDTIVVEDEAGEPAVRLFRIEASSKKITPATDNSDRIDKLAVSPDGRYAVALHQRSLHYTFDNKIKPIVLLHDLQRGKSRRLFPQPHWNVQDFRWAPDSRGFYAVNLHNSQPRFAQAGVLHLHYYDVAADACVPVDLGWPRGLAEQDDSDDEPALAATRDGFIALLADGARTRLVRYVRAGEGWRRTWLTGDHADRVVALQASADGKTLLYAHSTASTPTQWYRAALDGSRLDKPQAFAVLNPRLRQLPRARTEIVRWKGARGEEVEGILYYPHGYREGTKYPLVVMIHGGPASVERDAWDDGWTWTYPVQLVCQRGAFVLKPNYHGSSGYGLKWLESIARGRYGDLEVIDIEKGVDSLIARGLVDPGRLALSGWSNGAILTNLLTARTTRYRAAIAGAGNVEYVSDWGNCEFGDAFDRYYFGASPLENPLLYLIKSPFYRLERVRTPTLILFGDKDQTVPVHQGWLHYRALQQLGKTDVRLVLFPGEKHLLTKLVHQRRKVKEELAWLDRYLFDAAAKPKSARKAD